MAARAAAMRVKCFVYLSALLKEHTLLCKTGKGININFHALMYSSAYRWVLVYRKFSSSETQKRANYDEHYELQQC